MMDDIELTQKIDIDYGESNTNIEALEEVGYLLSSEDQRFAIKQGENVVGRADTCDIVVNHQTVSREHACIEAESATEVFVVDKDSCNKTKLGNVLLKPGRFYSLQHLCTIKFGDVSLEYHNLERESQICQDSTREKLSSPIENCNNNRLKESCSEKIAKTNSKRIQLNEVNHHDGDQIFEMETQPQTTHSLPTYQNEHLNSTDTSLNTTNDDIFELETQETVMSWTEVNSVAEESWIADAPKLNDSSIQNTTKDSDLFVPATQPQKAGSNANVSNQVIDETITPCKLPGDETDDEEEETQILDFDLDTPPLIAPTIVQSPVSSKETTEKRKVLQSGQLECSFSEDSNTSVESDILFGGETDMLDASSLGVTTAQLDPESDSHMKMKADKVLEEKSLGSNLNTPNLSPSHMNINYEEDYGGVAAPTLKDTEGLDTSMEEDFFLADTQPVPKAEISKQNGSELDTIPLDDSPALEEEGSTDPCSKKVEDPQEKKLSPEINFDATAQPIGQHQFEDTSTQAVAQEVDLDVPTQAIKEKPDSKLPTQALDRESGLDSPTQAVDRVHIDFDAPTQALDRESDLDAPTQAVDRLPIDFEAPTQALDVESDLDAPTQPVDRLPSDFDAPTKALDEESDLDAPTQPVDRLHFDFEAPTQVVDCNAPTEAVDEEPDFNSETQPADPKTRLDGPTHAMNVDDVASWDEPTQPIVHLSVKIAAKPVDKEDAVGDESATCNYKGGCHVSIMAEKDEDLDPTQRSTTCVSHRDDEHYVPIKGDEDDATQPVTLKSKVLPLNTSAKSMQNSKEELSDDDLLDDTQPTPATLLRLSDSSSKVKCSLESSTPATSPDNLLQEKRVKDMERTDASDANLCQMTKRSRKLLRKGRRAILDGIDSSGGSSEEKSTRKECITDVVTDLEGQPKLSTRKSRSSALPDAAKQESDEESKTVEGMLEREVELPKKGRSCKAQHSKNKTSSSVELDHNVKRESPRSRRSSIAASPIVGKRKPRKGNREAQKIKSDSPSRKESKGAQVNESSSPSKKSSKKALEMKSDSPSRKGTREVQEAKSNSRSTKSNKKAQETKFDSLSRKESSIRSSQVEYSKESKSASKKGRQTLSNSTSTQSNSPVHGRFVMLDSWSSDTEIGLRRMSKESDHVPKTYYDERSLSVSTSALPNKECESQSNVNKKRTLSETKSLVEETKRSNKKLRVDKSHESEGEHVNDVEDQANQEHGTETKHENSSDQGVVPVKTRGKPPKKERVSCLAAESPEQEVSELSSHQEKRLPKARGRSLTSSQVSALVLTSSQPSAEKIPNRKAGGRALKMKSATSKRTRSSNSESEQDQIAHRHNKGRSNKIESPPRKRGRREKLEPHLETITVSQVVQSEEETESKLDLPLPIEGMPKSRERVTRIKETKPEEQSADEKPSTSKRRGKQAPPVEIESQVQKKRARLQKIKDDQTKICQDSSNTAEKDVEEDECPTQEVPVLLKRGRVQKTKDNRIEKRQEPQATSEQEVDHFSTQEISARPKRGRVQKARFSHTEDDQDSKQTSGKEEESATQEVPVRLKRDRLQKTENDHACEKQEPKGASENELVDDSPIEEVPVQLKRGRVQKRKANHTERRQEPQATSEQEVDHYSTQNVPARPKRGRIQKARSSHTEGNQDSKQTSGKEEESAAQEVPVRLKRGRLQKTENGHTCEKEEPKGALEHKSEDESPTQEVSVQLKRGRGRSHKTRDDGKGKSKARPEEVEPSIQEIPAPLKRGGLQRARDSNSGEEENLKIAPEQDAVEEESPTQEVPIRLKRGAKGGRRSVVSEVVVNEAASTSIDYGRRQKAKADEKQATVPADKQTDHTQSLDSSLTETQQTNIMLGQNLKVLFTAIEQPAYAAKAISSLGGEIVESAFCCDVLISDKVRRTVKFLCAVARGIPVVQLKWLDDSKKKRAFQDPWKYIIKDQAGERKFSFQLLDTLRKSKDDSLLNNYKVFATNKTTPEPQIIKDLVKAAGGNYVSKAAAVPKENGFIVSSEDKKTWPKLKEKVAVVSTEILLTGILQHSLDIQKYSLK